MRQKQNLYLGIDGVILTRGINPAQHLNRFLEYIIGAYNVSWLSTRCRGNQASTISYLSKFVAADTITHLSKIKVAPFLLDKTEAIDFSQDFYWLEAELFDSEKNVLKKHDKLKSWIRLDLIKYPSQLINLTNNKLHFRVSMEEVN